MKKLNWGTKLGIMASLYVAGILAFVGFSATQKINLVSRDYYPDEVNYQNQIVKIKNAHGMKSPVLINTVNGQIQIQFPEEMRKNLHGDIVMYRPSDFESDLKYKIALNDSGIQVLNTNHILQGRYTIKLNWEHNKIPYYKEEAIYLSK